jgi:uncharacterized protein with PIN domain
MSPPRHEESAGGAPRLLADAMLGSLARWLRVLGLDTAYDPALDDAALVEKAVRERRVILTRDARLVARRRARNHLFIRSGRVEEQVRQVLGDLGIGIRPGELFGRCLRCNVPLENIAAEEARRRVPPFVARTQDRFRGCPRCGRLFWRATHVERMRDRLRAMGVPVA